MSYRVGMVMDPIESINTRKDSSFAMLLECQARGNSLFYMTADNLTVQNGEARALMSQIEVRDQPEDWFSIIDQSVQPLTSLDYCLMRKDPPFDMQYINDTYVLGIAEQAGLTVVNRPAALRDMNEKAVIAHFPQCTPETMIGRNPASLKAFIQSLGDAIVKPLDGMGGRSIFRVQADDPNLNVILETVSNEGHDMIMVQSYIHEIDQGDKRILIVDGETVPYALARIPAADDFRGNLAKGGSGHGIELSERDLWIANQVSPLLTERGVVFAGLDVIGDYLTEINVTSPTCIRELDQLFDLNIAGQLMDSIESSLR